ncbi:MULTISPECIES: DUF3253 domain-containing protein [Sphingobacterium]|uniref:DUF3253 domain-containing protein n=1 Tax=Sphingobacterium populi TaxID=1812824 RepID=A0ABW5UED7_9SPHI|nr:DUF3253 domain-containing protein [Sphingobacterium sp. CFCC 11742]
MSKNVTIKEAILSCVAERGADKSVCPSEIARLLFPTDWLEHMTDVVDVAIALHQQGKVVITQSGIAIDVEKIKGPIRITCV